ncbi:Leucine Rich repeat [Mactra antiquata]
MSVADSVLSTDSADVLEFGRRSNCSMQSMSRRATPVHASTPNRRTPSLKGSAKFMRTLSSSSKKSEVDAIKNLIQSRLLITETGYDPDDDVDFMDFANGRISRDTDYETDLEMDYEEWIAEDTGEIKDDDPQDKKYIHICNATGTIPASYFLRHIKDTKFRMRYHGLGPLGAKAISVPLKENHSIETLDLEGNWIEKEGAIYLSEMLKENMYLTELNIAENKLGREGADAICEILYKHEFLKSLNMSGNDLHDYGASKVCEMLQKNTCLKHLYLSHNHFEELGAFCFKEALSHNENLETLDLSWNHIRTNGAVAIAEGVQENYGLKTLNVSMNGFSDMGAEALGRALKHNRGLTKLDVSHNRISEVGAGHIALGLQTNDVLKELRIGYNPITTDGSMALLMAISKNDMSCLTRLDLSDILVSKDFKEEEKRLIRERILIIKHAGVLADRDAINIMHDPTETFRRNPFEKLKKYVRDAGYRLVDLFRDLDKDQSNTVTKEEFTRGLKNAGVEITSREILQLLEQLDINKDGVIDYQELVIGDKDYRRSLIEDEQCPDERQIQREQNRITRKRSQMLNDIITV